MLCRPLRSVVKQEFTVLPKAGGAECRNLPMYTSRKVATRYLGAGHLVLACEGLSMTGKAYESPSPKTYTTEGHI